MIPVTPATEPAEFDARVRTPGAVFLALNPTPVGQDWDGKEYWRKSIGDLSASYHHLCAYCASWTVKGKAKSKLMDRSVDHFVPKGKSPILAYEWSNFRLSRSRINGKKGQWEDVLDPFVLPAGWFTLNFRTFFIEPSDTLGEQERAKVDATLIRLELNTDNDYINERINVIRHYCRGKIAFNNLRRKYPFIAHEMTRQDFDNVFRPTMRPKFEAGL